MKYFSILSALFLVIPTLTYAAIDPPSLQLDAGPADIQVETVEVETVRGEADPGVTILEILPLDEIDGDPESSGSGEGDSKGSETGTSEIFPIEMETGGPVPIGDEVISSVKESPPVAETDKERLARMLAPFDYPNNYVSGSLFVSFTENTTKDQADNILKKYDFGIVEEEHCSTSEGTGPNPSDTTIEAVCEVVSSWDSELVGARIIVLEGEERQLAQKLIQEKEIIWVEPNNIATSMEETRDTSVTSNLVQPATVQPSDEIMVLLRDASGAADKAETATRMNRAELIEELYAADVFIKIDDIKGESQDTDTKKPKEIVVVGSKARDETAVPQLIVPEPATESASDSFFDVFVGVATEEDLQLHIVAAVQNDVNINEVRLGEDAVVVDYATTVRLFGFIPVETTQKVTVRFGDGERGEEISTDEFGRVKVQFPWWHIFGTKAVSPNDLEDVIEDELASKWEVSELDAKGTNDETADRPVEDVAFYYNKIAFAFDVVQTALKGSKILEN